jgi:hypothetical protein
MKLVISCQIFQFKRLCASNKSKQSKGFKIMADKHSLSVSEGDTISHKHLAIVFEKGVLLPPNSKETDYAALPSSPLGGGGAPAAHTHAQSEVTNLVNDLAAKATVTALTSEATTRANADTLLQTNIDAKAATVHVHTAANITDFNAAADARIANSLNMAAPAYNTLLKIATELADDDTETALLVTEVGNKLDKSGGTMAGSLILNADATVALGAVTKQQLDNKFSTAGTGDVKADGTVPFTAVQSGVTPTAAAHLTTKAYVDTGLGTKAETSHTHAISDIANLQTQLDAKAATSHSHAIADVTNLQTNLDALVKLDGSTAFQNPQTGVNGVNSTHLVTKGQLDTKADLSHTHAIGDTAGLQTALDSKSATSHTHVIADVTNLQTSLDAKAASTHTHVKADITDGAMVGATASVAGQAGFVPAPAAGDNTKFLTGAGTFATPAAGGETLKIWAASTAYAVGDLIQSQGAIYRVMNAVTSGATWAADKQTNFANYQFVGMIGGAGIRAPAWTANTPYYWGEMVSIALVEYYVNTNIAGSATFAVGTVWKPAYANTRNDRYQKSVVQTSAAVFVPLYARYAKVLLCGGGGGGGGGGFNATTTVALSGGGGGPAGSLAEGTIDLTGVTSLNVVIGAGGAGGVGGTAPAVGVAGSPTSISNGATLLMQTRQSGFGGVGGTTAAVGGAGATSTYSITRGGGAGSLTAAPTTPVGGTGSLLSSGSGGGGGTISAANAIFNAASGGIGGDMLTNSNTGGAAGSSSATVAGTAGGAGLAVVNYAGGGGGAGGGSSTIAAGGVGGAGTNGAGGGGGGSSRTSAGAGGAGGNGYAVIEFMA